MLGIAHVRTLCFLQPGSLCGCLPACLCDSSCNMYCMMPGDTCCLGCAVMLAASGLCRVRLQGPLYQSSQEIVVMT